MLTEITYYDLPLQFFSFFFAFKNLSGIIYPVVKEVYHPFHNRVLFTKFVSKCQIKMEN